MHALTEIAEGIPWGRSDAVRFFCTQVMGIMFEDGVQAIVSRMRMQFHGHRVMPPVIYLWAGYVWVAAFLIWSTSIWIYASLYENKGEEKDLTVPFSIIRWLSNLINQQFD